MPRFDATYEGYRVVAERLMRDNLETALAAVEDELRARRAAGAKLVVADESWSPVWGHVDRGMEFAADAVGKDLTRKLGGTTWDVSRMAESLNDSAGDIVWPERERLQSMLFDGMTDDEFDDAMRAMREGIRDRMVTNAATESINAGALEAAQMHGAATKVWQVNSRNPRSAHAALNGQRVAVGAKFSNGMPYPRGGGPPEQTVNCRCSMVIEKAVRDAG